MSQNPLAGDASYIEKLRMQLADVSPSAAQLMAELHWILLLFPHNIKPQTKRDLFRELWELSEEPFDSTHPLLEDNVLGGAAHAGTAFNTHRWRELVFLIQISTDFKQLDREQRQQVLSDPWVFSKWLAAVPREGYRQFRHILRWLLFPDTSSGFVLAPTRRLFSSSLNRSLQSNCSSGQMQTLTRRYSASVCDWSRKAPVTWTSTNHPGRSSGAAPHAVG